MKNIFFIVIIFLAAVGFSGCGSGGGEIADRTVPVPSPAVTTPITPDPSPVVELDPIPLGEVRYWAMQLQGIEKEGQTEVLMGSPYDMLILEPTRTNWVNTDARDFDTAKMVRKLKQSSASDGKHRKLVIAYVSIGACEMWRWYWTWSRVLPVGGILPADWPDYILGVDPNCWPGNYPVAYWDSRWKNIIITGANQDSRPYGNYSSAIDQVLKDGFDGVYLDWVSGYSVNMVKDRAALDGVDGAGEMYRFIREIREYAHSRNPDFMIFQGNGFDLHTYEPGIFNLVDGLVQQSIWYRGTAHGDWSAPGTADVAVNPDDTAHYLAHLKDWQAAGKVVFNLEYAAQYADEAYRLSRIEGLIPYCSRRALSRLSETPPR